MRLTNRIHWPLKFGVKCPSITSSELLYLILKDIQDGGKIKAYKDGLRLHLQYKNKHYVLGLSAKDLMLYRNGKLQYVCRTVPTLERYIESNI